MNAGAVVVLGLGAALAATSVTVAQLAPFETAEPSAATNHADELIEARLGQLGIEPALPCSDEVFLRRAYLDVIGTLPTLFEARRFLEDTTPDKRHALIDALLERPEFADYQAMRWCDLLRVKAEFPINLWPNAVQAYHRWIHTSIAQDLPYDRFVRALLTASGSNFRVPEVNFYRAVQEKTPEGLAKTAALTFLGARVERWPAERQVGFARFFAKVGFKTTQEWKEEIVFFDADQPVGPKHARGSFTAVLPDDTEVTIGPDVDPRTVLAHWLLADGNQILARCLCNRIWYSLLGRGIVHEPDDFRLDNAPSNPELLDWLAGELIGSGWDQKHVFRTILNSRAYQRSAIPRSDHAAAAANFAHYSIRPLEAEVLIDAICQITGTTETYTSPIPEPFTFIPVGQRAIALADGSTTSAFLEMFGRPPRDTGLALERSSEPTTGQRLHLLNSSHVQQKLQRGRNLALLMRSARNRPQQVLTDLYLTILSRRPTRADLDAVRDYTSSGVANARQVVEDVAWALLNTAEFLYRH